MEKKPIRLDQYVRQLWEKRRQEPITEDIINDLARQDGQGLTSPPGEEPTEELKIIQESIMRQNMLSIGNALPHRKKVMMLRQFFKHKRNQLVEVFSKNAEVAVRTTGKVSVIGRDFVGLTTLRERIWIPYHAIRSANVPFGLPDVPTTHQHIVFDEELRRNLLTRFGETVAKRDELMQRFFEESLQTHLHTWRGMRVEVIASGEKMSGKIRRTENGQLVIKQWQEEVAIPLAEITCLRTWRWLQLLPWKRLSQQ